MNSLTQQGIAAVKAGDRTTAKRLFESALQLNHREIDAWLWMTAVAETDQEKLRYLQEALKIDPHNRPAAQGVAQLIAQGRATLTLNAPPAAALPSEAAIPAQAVYVAAPPAPPAAQPEREIFSVTPSLAPLLIGTGVVVLLSALLLALAYAVLEANDPTLAEMVPICGSLYLVLMVLLPRGVRMLRLLFTRYQLTTRNLILESGVFAKNHTTIPVQKIQDVSYRQSFGERLLGIGDVVVESAGGWGKIRLFDLNHCTERTRQILAVIDR